MSKNSTTSGCVIKHSNNTMNKSTIFAQTLTPSPFTISDTKSMAFSTLKSPSRNNFMTMDRAGTAKTKICENSIFFNKNLS